MKILLKEITKKFNDYDVVLKKINCHFSKNNIYVITGNSGAGKSTLLRIIAGIEKPYSGKVLHLDESGKKNHSRHSIALILQENNLLFDFSVLENLALPLLIKGQSIELAKKEVFDLMNKFGIEQIKDKQPHEISGGQKQRVAILRAILLGADFLLADEPTTGLDKDNAQIVIDSLLELKQKQMAIIIATHDESLIKIADKVLFLNDGLLQDGL